MELDFDEFLKPQIIGQDNGMTATATIVDEGQYKTRTFQGKEKRMFELHVDLNNKIYSWTPTLTTLKNLTTGFGSKDTKVWVGKQIKLTRIFVVVNGQQKSSILGEVIKA